MLLPTGTATLISSLGAGESKSSPLAQYRGMKASLMLNLRLLQSLGNNLGQLLDGALKRREKFPAPVGNRSPRLQPLIGSSHVSYPYLWAEKHLGKKAQKFWNVFKKGTTAIANLNAGGLSVHHFKEDNSQK
jgi:hypothetical protein